MAVLKRFPIIISVYKVAAFEIRELESGIKKLDKRLDKEEEFVDSNQERLQIILLQMQQLPTSVTLANTLINGPITKIKKICQHIICRLISFKEIQLHKLKTTSTNKKLFVEIFANNLNSSSTHVFYNCFGSVALSDAHACPSLSDIFHPQYGHCTVTDLNMGSSSFFFEFSIVYFLGSPIFLLLLFA